jgi:hypothetical protein
VTGIGFGPVPVFVLQGSAGGMSFSSDCGRRSIDHSHSAMDIDGDGLEAHPT